MGGQWLDGAPSRAPLEVTCDRRTARLLARTALLRSLRGRGGVLLLVTCATLGVAITVGTGSAPLGLLLGAGLGGVQVAAGLHTAGRSFQRMAPPGQVLRTAHDPQGHLSVTTGVGTTTLAPGTVDRVERLGDLVHLRLLPGRRWALLPAALFTEADLTRLTGGPAAPAAAVPDEGALTAPGRLIAPGSPPAGPGPFAGPVDLPLLHVVTPESRRLLEAALVRHVWTRPSGALLLGASAVGLAAAALGRNLTTLVPAGLVAALCLLATATTVRDVRRQRPLGHLIRAAVTADHLLLAEGGSTSAVPWSSVRSCAVSTGGVLLTLGTGVMVPLPRALFPAADLARLDDAVRASRTSAT